MADIWNRNDGLPIGYEAQSTSGLPPPLDKPIRYGGDRHWAVVGPNGSGKTKRLLIPALVENTGWSCVVVDIKGELCSMSAEHRRRAGNQIIILNPFDTLELGSSGCNPIAALPINDDLADDALELAESIIAVDNSNEPHWAQAAQELIAALIMFVRLVIPGGSFADVRELLGRDDQGWRVLVRGGRNTDPRQLELWERTEDKDRDPSYRPPVHHRGKLYPGMIAASIIHGWPEIETKIARFGSIVPEDREMHGVISTALIQTRWLDSRAIKRDLAKNPIDFSSIKDKPTTIYLILPARRLGTHSAWLRLMISGIVQKLLKDTRTAKCPVLLMLDEYYAIAAPDGFPYLARLMPVMRGFGIKILSVWQDLAQAEALYEKGFNSFLGNAGVVQAFAPQELLTSDYLSRMTGQTTKYVSSRGESLNPSPGQPTGFSVSRSQNVNSIAMPLMLPHQVRAMGEGYTLVFSHKADGPLRVYVPWPGNVRHLQHVMSLDPANRA